MNSRSDRKGPGPRPSGRQMRDRRSGYGLARALAIALGSIAALSAFSAPAATQTLEDVQRALENTDNVILQAETIVSDSRNALARDYLEQAKQLQSRARGAFDALLLADALRLTEAARRRALAAIELVRQAGSAEFLTFALDRTDALLDRISSVLRECPSEQAERLFARAQDMQRRAREALNAGRPRVALSLTMQSRELAMRALRISEDSCGQVSDRARRTVERTAQLLEDSAWLMQAGDRSARGYEAALRFNARAEDQLGAKHYPAALELALRARDQLVRALNQAERPLARDAVQDAVRRSGERLATVSSRADDGRERQAIERATDHQRRAEQLVSRGRLAAALAEVRAVMTILDRAGL